MRTKKWSWILAVRVGVLGAVLAAAWTYLSPPPYTSQGTVVEVSANQAESLNRRMMDALSPSSLRSLLDDENLYPDKMARDASAEAMDTLRQNIKILRGRDAGTVVIAFTDSDPAVAQRITQALITRLPSASFKQREAASYPVKRDGLHPIVVIAIGLLAGFFLGACLALVLRRIAA